MKQRWTLEDYMRVRTLTPINLRNFYAQSIEVQEIPSFIIMKFFSIKTYWGRSAVA